MFKRTMFWLCIAINLMSYAIDAHGMTQFILVTLTILCYAAYIWPKYFTNGSIFSVLLRPILVNPKRWLPVYRKNNLIPISLTDDNGYTFNNLKKYGVISFAISRNLDNNKLYIVSAEKPNYLRCIEVFIPLWFFTTELITPSHRLIVEERGTIDRPTKQITERQMPKHKPDMGITLFWPFNIIVFPITLMISPCTTIILSVLLLRALYVDIYNSTM